MERWVDGGGAPVGVPSNGPWNGAVPVPACAVIHTEITARVAVPPTVVQPEPAFMPDRTGHLALPPHAKVSMEHLRNQDETMVCTVCTLLACEPVVTRCAHVFCYDCMGSWVQACPPIMVSCPACESQLSAGDIVQLGEGSLGAHGFLWQLYTNTQLFCAHHRALVAAGLCTWQGRVRDYQRHILEECPGQQLTAAPALIDFSPGGVVWAGTGSSSP